MSQASRTEGRLPAPPKTVSRRISSFFGTHRKLSLTALLAAPLAWLILIYIISLLLLLVTAFWSTDSFTGQVVQEWTLGNFTAVFTEALYRAVTLRTLIIAASVTIIDVVIALPVGYFMSKVAGPRLRGALVVAFLMPLWAAYLVKAYAWRTIVSPHGLFDSLGISPGLGLVATIITMSYIWLPYVVMPVYTGFERIPDNLIEAAGDLGAKGRKTFTAVVIPLVWPSVIAGSIFSFSLTLGDYIAVQIVGGSQQLLGTLIYANVGTGGNMPLAAATSFIPIAVIVIYLTAVRRTGALKNL